MKKTQNFNLLKPEGQEKYNIEDFNNNMDIIDRRMYANMQSAQSVENHLNNVKNPHNVTKAQIGLDKVDNTSDSEKPISIQQQAALDAKQDILAYDEAPTENSMKMVRSGGIFNFIKNFISVFTGATSTTPGARGLVPAPSAGVSNRFLKANGDWAKVTKSDVGLGSVGNYKAVSTAANQNLSATEQANARTNIAAGTSNFSGSFSDLVNVPDWVRSDTKPVYLASEIGAYSKTEVDNKLSSLNNYTSIINMIMAVQEENLKTIFGEVTEFNVSQDENKTLYEITAVGSHEEGFPFLALFHVNANHIVWNYYAVLATDREMTVGSTFTEAQFSEAFITIEGLGIPQYLTQYMLKYVPFGFVINEENGKDVYGYMTKNGTFVPFASQPTL